MRQVIHLDLDAFYASVEILLNPAYADQPLVVAMGQPRGRGVVSTASYAARKFGIHSAMPLSEAMRLCPQVIMVPVRHALYAEYSRRVMNLAREYSAQLEQVSIDEAYLEIPEDKDGLQIAEEIQRRVKNEIGLDSTLAVASNKLVAKIACNTVKPRGLLRVPTGTEETFLASLPVSRLPGAGPVTRERLQRWRVTTIGDLAAVPPEELRAAFGKLGSYLSEGAHGRNDSPVVADRETKSISQEQTFERDTRDATAVARLVSEMSAGVAEELAREGLRARTIVLKLRYSDFSTATRQITLATPTADTSLIESHGLRLLKLHWNGKRALRLVGVGAHNLVEPHEQPAQLTFPGLDE